MNARSTELEQAALEAVLKPISAPLCGIYAVALATGLRDPDDAPILATLVEAGADYLVTGDKDLLALAPGYPIVTPAEFCVRHAP